MLKVHLNSVCLLYCVSVQVMCLYNCAYYCVQREYVCDRTEAICV